MPGELADQSRNIVYTRRLLNPKFAPLLLFAEEEVAMSVTACSSSVQPRCMIQADRFACS